MPALCTTQPLLRVTVTRMAGLVCKLANNARRGEVVRESPARCKEVFMLEHKYTDLAGVELSRKIRWSSQACLKPPIGL
jgi:hypothetical protein